MNTSFTYSPEDLSTALAQLRLAIGDTDSRSGVRPDGRNYSDAELTFFLMAAKDVVGVAAANLLNSLAVEYATASRHMFATGTPEAVTAARTFADIAKSLREQASTWRSNSTVDETVEEVAEGEGVAYGGTDVTKAYFGLPAGWLW